MSLADSLSKYREKFIKKSMRRPADNSDELRQMTHGDGMFALADAPLGEANAIVSDQLPDSAENADRNRHLWVIASNEMPCAVEACKWGATLQTGKIKHSNLTGGAEAYSGGEIWFIDNRTIVINADSGRYGAESHEEFDQIVDALANGGYRVASMGFDLENPRKPNSILVGSPRWIDKAE